jgi:hypothetical protein
MCEARPRSLSEQWQVVAAALRVSWQRSRRRGAAFGLAWGLAVLYALFAAAWETHPPDISRAAAPFNYGNNGVGS